MVVKRVGVWSVARVAGGLYASLGLVFGAILTVVALAGVGFIRAGGGDAPIPFLGILLGGGAIIVLPILYGLMGGIIAAFLAWMYNILAGVLGGLEVDIE